MLSLCNLLHIVSVPHSNFHLSVNPVQLTIEPSVCLWLVSFVKAVFDTLWRTDLVSMPGRDFPSAFHLLLCIERSTQWPSKATNKGKLRLSS